MTGLLDGVLRYAVAGLRADGTWGLALEPVGTLVATAELRPVPAVHRPSRHLRALSPRI